MTKKVQPKILPGFMELLPQDQLLFNHMVDTIRGVYEEFGFMPLDTPVIEYADVLLAKAGGETEKQIYRFNKGDNDLALRFDLTVPLARYVALHYNDLTFPFKRYQMGKVYRGERPQHGRYREFYQCDIDVIGNASIPLTYDAEMPAIIYEIFKRLDFGPFVIRYNNRKILNGFFASLELTDMVSDVLRIIDKLDKIGLDNVKEELVNMGISQDKIDKILSFIQIKGTNQEILTKLMELAIDDENYRLGVEELKTVTDMIADFNLDSASYQIDLTIARGLDYYTGTVYETNLVNYPSLGSICSGGRYDNLTGFYTNEELPGIGISIGLTRLFSQLKEAGLIKASKKSLIDVLVVPMDDNDLSYTLRVADMLRQNNLKVDIYYGNKGMKQKMKYANHIGVNYVIIIGSDEIQKEMVSLKNMITFEQENVLLTDLVSKLTS